MLHNYEAEHLLPHSASINFFIAPSSQTYKEVFVVRILQRLRAAVYIQYINMYTNFPLLFLVM